MRIGISIQARLGSKRLPGKVLLKLEGKTLLEHVYDRMLMCEEADIVWVAAPVGQTMVPGLRTFYGSEENLLSRHLEAAMKYDVDAVVRVTADCLFHDPKLIDEGIKTFNGAFPPIHTLSNWTKGRSWSEGVDYEIYSTRFLRRLEEDEKCPREGFATYCDEKNLLSRFFAASYTDGNLKLSIDTPQDFERAQYILGKLGGSVDYKRTRDEAIRYDALHQGKDLQSGGADGNGP
jgi:spore coat polysaccharide biosynthesis protein SpsF